MTITLSMPKHPSRARRPFEFTSLAPRSEASARYSFEWNAFNLVSVICLHAIPLGARIQLKARTNVARTPIGGLGSCNSHADVRRL